MANNQQYRKAIWFTVNSNENLNIKLKGQDIWSNN